MQPLHDWIERLRAQLRLPLPGEEAQYRMAPSYRPKLSREEILSYNPRAGGVLVLLYPKSNELHIAFTKRKEYPGVHSGQMSFPGGKKEECDSSLTHTALREASEEIGIDISTVDILGTLSEVYIPPSNFLVLPTVGFTSLSVPFGKPNDEVDEIIEIPLSFFLKSESVCLQKEIRLFNGHKTVVPAYVYGSYVIWGATAIILSEFTYIAAQIAENR
ncbi:MAG: CoA pyrophosphatase [Chitinophagales bacterium]|nr:CoA pyrophosphatase [Chitinophagales bacterium]MDW8418751.1 CoA pyrophosphatase [Chitinophagales bacterium]